ncbi:MAG: NADH-quinone oxidoreductase subunit N [Planctomycetaceae bacterium]|nr:NADH-quinone oxidoreductase subunit N [Planctomycetaceae bacterium]
MSTDTLTFLLPEVILVLVASLVYVVGAFVQKPALWTWVAVATIVAAGAALFAMPADLQPGATVARDGLAHYISLLALGAGLLLVLLSSRSADPRLAPEYVGSLMLTVAGTMLVGAAQDLVLIFLGLELISIPTYVLLYLGRGSSAARESAAKYFYLSILSSAVMLYGFSFVYGVGGSTSLVEVRAALTAALAEPTKFLEVGSLATVLLFAGLGFKIAAVPFHFYAPDVYQGTNYANGAVLSVLPKIAGLVALVRIVAIAMPGEESTGWRLAMVLAALTMTVGNVLALWQENLRRMLAYSSIANVGYMLIGLAVGFVTSTRPEVQGFDGIGAMLFYLVAYTVATLGAFATLTYLGAPDRQVNSLDDIAGVFKTQPLMAACLGVSMFSLTGIPPLAGFWGKFGLFFGALTIPGEPGDSSIKIWFVVLALIGALNAAISAGYYLRVIAVAYFRPAQGTPAAAGGAGSWLVAVTCALLTIGLGFAPRPLWEESLAASRQARAANSAPADEPRTALNAAHATQGD